MGEKHISKKKIVLISVVSILFIALIAFTPCIVNNYRELQEYNEFKENIENITKLDLPNKGSLVYVDFQDWIIYGNTVPINQMSYLVFKDLNQIEDFEANLDSDPRWITVIDNNFLEFVPTNIQDYASIGDYSLIYNLDLNTYNNFSIETGIYELLFLIYQKDINRVIIFDYSIHIIGGE